MKPIKIKYEGTTYWFQEEEDGGGPVAPVEHCEESGALKIPECFSSPTFGHVYADRSFIRFGKRLGTIDDFII